MLPVERFPVTKIDDLLAFVLAEPGTDRRADRSRRRAFLRHVEDACLGCQGFGIRAGVDVRGAALALSIPGRTGLIILAPPAELGIRGPEQAAVLDAAVAYLAGTELHFIQSLVEPQGHGKAADLTTAGFRRLAGLLYLERDSRFPWVEASPVGSVQWVAYEPTTHGLFCDTISQSYEGSFDCPEVAGLRPMDDVIAGHRAAGRFDPRLWEVATIHDAAAGCILLSAVADELLEVVYMGVVPTYRGRGVGQMLLRRAVEHARARRRARVTLVVDERNAPARRLYDRFGLAAVTTRDVYLLTPRRC